MIGVIGGSGMDDLDTLADVRTVEITTEYGTPSAPVTIGTLAGREVAFLTRHGRGHGLLPAEVPYRANIAALRELGVRQVLAVSAVGSLTERLAPGTLVVPDQIVDRTRGARAGTFFGDGVVGHVPMAEPYCGRLRKVLLAAGPDGTVDGATYCCIEGPQFSTRAESHLYRSWGLDVIGMTAVPEAALAREAGLCYAALALVTDYDCWHESAESVTAELVAQTVRANVTAARAVLAEGIAQVDPGTGCACRRALDGAIITDPAAISRQARARLGIAAATGR
ncbi:S-methyl-5'-thioadenosine phosphorylase [Actinoplanes sp. RD1]|uniref:S-methyl-5'-thioadenosine phosphorylase n=1 Tax=Actinoplanes sp. RD1 TaxID=3064538 RepID=UPI002741CE5B|nr:S-methyl-5'-thioadenosine phosphorylase [Actinoplanes sp. RD1]